MPAIRFFSVLQAGRKIQAKRDAWQTVLRADAASISLADGKYYEEMRKYYLRQALGAEEFEAQALKKALDPTDPKTAALVSDLFKQAERFV